MRNLFASTVAPPAPVVKNPEAERLKQVARALRDLTLMEPWSVYQAQVGVIEAQALQSLLTQGKDKHDYWQGYIEGLRTATQLPEKMSEAATR